MTRLQDLPLRQRKQAQTRLALLHAVLARLDGTRTLEDINVRELCAEASISEASFFNYFPKKTDLLEYFIRLWSLELAWRVRHELADKTAREAIEAIFTSTARQSGEHPGVMAEIIAFQARQTEPEGMELELADRLAAYPDRPGIEDVPAIGLDGLLPQLIARAIDRGELPASTDRTAALLALTSVFFGVPLILQRQAPALIEPVYRQQLALVWAGLAHAPPAARPRSPASRKRAKGAKS